MNDPQMKSVSIRSFRTSSLSTLEAPHQLNDQLIDQVAVEEPLEIRVKIPGQGESRRLSVTMRTPGHDLELALGFLWGEGVLRSPLEVTGFETGPNQVEVSLEPSERIDLKRFERSTFVSSSCGVCGKSSIEAVFEASRFCDRTGPGTGPFVSPRVILGLPERLRQAQSCFETTGGVHASGLFTPQGELICSREDVGRHNALDKVVGAAVLSQTLPLDQALLLVSGRVSFELMQKAALAGIRIVVAVGAPTSLALELARELDLTVIGFLRESRFNIYHGHWRIECK